MKVPKEIASNYSINIAQPVTVILANIIKIKE